MQKATAIMALSFNMKLISQFPNIMKESLEEFKSDMQDIKEAVE